MTGRIYVLDHRAGYFNKVIENAYKWGYGIAKRTYMI